MKLARRRSVGSAPPLPRPRWGWLTTLVASSQRTEARPRPSTPGLQGGLGGATGTSLRRTVLGGIGTFYLGPAFPTIECFPPMPGATAGTIVAVSRVPFCSEAGGKHDGAALFRRSHLFGASRSRDSPRIGLGRDREIRHELGPPDRQARAQTISWLVQRHGVRQRPKPARQGGAQVPAAGAPYRWGRHKCAGIAGARWSGLW